MDYLNSVTIFSFCFMFPFVSIFCFLFLFLFAFVCLFFFSDCGRYRDVIVGVVMQLVGRCCCREVAAVGKFQYEYETEGKCYPPMHLYSHV